MNEKREFQRSESFAAAALLALSGGLLDAYTYLCRGGVFANAQTGNIVLLSTNIMDGRWDKVLHYLVPLCAFALGVLAAEKMREHFQAMQRLHWRQLVVLGEVLLLFLVGGVALHPGNRRDHGEQEGKLSVLLEIGLAEDGALFGIEAGTDPVLDHLDGVFPERLGSVEIRGERVPVSHEEEGSQLVLEVHPVLEDAEIMSEMEGTGGAHARSSANFSTHGKCSFED